jgi:hypothetical protein
MTINRRAQDLSDRIGADVDYRGVNVRRQHMAASGGPLVSHLFDTLEEMVARFGKRIKIASAKFKHSTPFQNGYNAKTYSPRPEADQQELHEYGSGYLWKLLNPVAAKVAPVVVAPVLTRAESDAALMDAMRTKERHSQIMAKDTTNLKPFTHEQLMGEPTAIADEDI